MNYINSKHLLPLIIAASIAFSACNNNKRKTERSETKDTATASPTAESKYTPVNTWLDDFKNFRTAVYEDDLVKMKSYFNFPVTADTTQIWTAVYDSAEESKRPETYPDTFTDADFAKHRHKIFTDAFIKSLLKVKSELLFKKGEYTTPVIKEKGQSFHMIAQYDKATTTLQLSVMYSGGVDENGEEVSEGEYATIYFFKVENNKYLKFDKILFAG